jgi:hypothetical protein
MLLVQCDGCGTQVFLDCTCPPGWDPRAQGGHIPEVTVGGVLTPACPFGNLDAQVTCPPSSDCCQLEHDHAQPCPVQHDEPCPEPPGQCKTWAGMTADARHPAYKGKPPGPCPGGHCHKDLESCTGCRALTITAVPGSAQVQLAAAIGAGG